MLNNQADILGKTQVCGSGGTFLLIPVCGTFQLSMCMLAWHALKAVELLYLMPLCNAV